VRGHWRRQVHGPRWSLRQVIWIEPFVRRPTGADAEGHEYAVKDDHDLKKNARANDIAAEIARRLAPILGRPIASEVANNAYMFDDEEQVPVVVAVRDVLMQRKRHPSLLKRTDPDAGPLTDAMIDAALTAVEDMEV
jgi:hypothetical protein